MPLQIFCDEFGNTGGRLLDPEQPVLVYAFMMFQAPALETVGEQVQLLLQEGASSPSELKSSQLLKSPLGRRRYEEIGRYVSDVGARICLSIVEKRYQACSLIRDTYLDPFEHEFAPREIGNRYFAQRFADACYDTLSDERLAEFLAAVDNDVPEEIAAIGQRFLATLRLHPDDFVSHAANCIETRSEKVFRRAQRRATLPKNSHISASQYAAFHPGLDCLEACLRAMGESGALLRDRDAQFGEMLDWAYAIGRELDQHPGAQAYGAQRQLDSIESCASVSSEQQLGIQLADLAAGLVGRIARDVCRQAPAVEHLYRIAGSWHATLIEMERHYVMVSDARLVDLAPALFGPVYAPARFD
jgi:hypothetical protein